ncbi:hypothetical protein LEP1GSC170_2492 [Leptospira interrogans serovar Bataviae str. HAI135]|nr:hypothetical protein LEP1GSC170_2492 [Leptospira interrogans serovar Bataviae str. HAI135]
MNTTVINFYCINCGSSYRLKSLFIFFAILNHTFPNEILQ